MSFRLKWSPPSFRRFPLLPFNERKSLFENISGIDLVVEHKTLSYGDILRELRPTYGVYGDDWRTGFQKPIRDEVVSVLAEYGGKLVEYPYSKMTGMRNWSREAVNNLPCRITAVDD